MCSTIFRLSLLTVAALACLMLVSLNIFYVIYLLFLPPLPSQLCYDGNNCAQRRILKQFIIQENLSQLNFGYIQSIWFTFTPELIFFITFPFSFDYVFSLFFFIHRTKHLSEKRKFVIAHMQRIALENVEPYGYDYQINTMFMFSVFNTFPCIISWIIYKYYITLNEFNDGIHCLRLIDVIQIASCLSMGYYRGHTRRFFKLLLKKYISTEGEENNKNVEYLHRAKKRSTQHISDNNNRPSCGHLLHSLFVTFITDPINFAGISIFSICCVLKTITEHINECSLTSHMLNVCTLLQPLLALPECICTLSAGCPLEHFIFAEFIFCLSISYIFRIFKHWHRLSIQRRYIALIYPTICEEKTNIIMNLGNIILIYFVADFEILDVSRSLLRWLIFISIFVLTSQPFIFFKFIHNLSNK